MPIASERLLQIFVGGNKLNNNYPSWICADCGEKYGRYPEGNLSTWHDGDVCGWCGERKATTEPRDYRYPPAPKRKK